MKTEAVAVRLTKRIFVVLAAFIAACISAGVATNISSFVVAIVSQSTPYDTSAQMVLYGLIHATVAVAAISFLPFWLLIVAESFKIRFAAVYALTEVAILLTYWRSSLSVDRTTIFVVAGAAFGLTYWMIAGRNAGRWRGEQVQVQ